jgi:hypothetical protein
MQLLGIAGTKMQIIRDTETQKLSEVWKCKVLEIWRKIVGDTIMAENEFTKFMLKLVLYLLLLCMEKYIFSIEKLTTYFTFCFI